MNGDFQQTYQAAERAYGGGDYETAHHLASGLLKQLEAEIKADDELVRDAVLGWQAFVTLLLGHIELHGRQRPDQAAEYYQLTLDCQPQDTLADLAKQGLQRSKSAQDELGAPPPTTDESFAGSLPSMLQDPFLNNAAPTTTPGLTQTTAMPWLTGNSSPPQARETRAPAPRQMDEPVRSKPELSEPVMTSNDEPTHQEQPLTLVIPEESFASAWLRVSITTD